MKGTLAVWSTFLLMVIGLLCLGAAKTVEATKAKVAIKEVATFIVVKWMKEERVWYEVWGIEYQGKKS